MDGLPFFPSIPAYESILQSDVVVGLPSMLVAERLDKEEPGWKISGKYVCHCLHVFAEIITLYSRLWSCFLKVDLESQFALLKGKIVESLK